MDLDRDYPAVVAAARALARAEFQLWQTIIDQHAAGETAVLSYAAPHLFGRRLAAFDEALRELLSEVGPDDRFDEELREIAVDVWRPGTAAG